ncbi:DUF882 domain-containing protein [bacterium]|nr:DUF882 domain-containing protein [bacterium]
MKLSRRTIALFIAVFIPCLVHANERFLYTGDGNLTVKNSHSGASASLNYRDATGRLSPQAQAAFNKVWNVPAPFNVAPRLISLLDYVQDKYLKGAPLVIDSGYRSPTHNENLRKKGKLAGQTSYHIEAMAADLGIDRKTSQKIWEELREFKYGGVGFYGSGELHVDSGKPRFWDAATALPKDKSPPENRNIYLNVDYDVYQSGENVKLTFTGVSDFPFGVKRQMSLLRGGKKEKIEPLYKSVSSGDCVVIQNRTEAHGITLQLADDLKNGEYEIEAEFCDPKTQKMPEKIFSRVFKID